MLISNELEAPELKVTDLKAMTPIHEIEIWIRCRLILMSRYIYACRKPRDYFLSAFFLASINLFSSFSVVLTYVHAHWWLLHYEIFLGYLGSWKYCWVNPFKFLNSLLKLFENENKHAFCIAKILSCCPTFNLILAFPDFQSQNLLV